MTPLLLIRERTHRLFGWIPVGGVEDCRLQSGKLLLDGGHEINGDVMAVVVRRKPLDAGQQLIARLRDSDPVRLIDGRIMHGRTAVADFTWMVCGDEPAGPGKSTHVFWGRVLGIRPAGELPRIRPTGLA